jgi:hypothetical protein
MKNKKAENKKHRKNSLHGLPTKAGALCIHALIKNYVVV